MPSRRPFFVYPTVDNTLGISYLCTIISVKMNNNISIDSHTSFHHSHQTRFKIASFLWQHLFLLISLYIMTLGVALTIKSCLGSSVISSIPMDMSLAGAAGLAPALTVGEYTNLMNMVLVGVQILILRRRFEKVQLFQLVIGTMFGWLLDLNIWVTSMVNPESLISQSIVQLLGCIVLGIGIAFEIKCGSITMPGEGVPAAISKSTGMQFAKAKIMVDISLVAIAVVLGYIFFNQWLINIIGPGTLFAMVFVGLVVKFVDKRTGWFDSLLNYQPGFRRYIYGLAKYVKTR